MFPRLKVELFEGVPFVRICRVDTGEAAYNSRYIDAKKLYDFIMKCRRAKKFNSLRNPEQGVKKFNGRRAFVTRERVQIGCQKIYFVDIDAFALSQGWVKYK